MFLDWVALPPSPKILGFCWACPSEDLGSTASFYVNVLHSASTQSPPCFFIAADGSFVLAFAWARARGP